jgi:preprotein translocase subunit SecE
MVARNYWRTEKGQLAYPQEAWRLTKIVIVVIIAMGTLLGGLDFLFTKLIGLIVG